MRPEPLALTLDQTTFRTASDLYGTPFFLARLAQLRDYLGLPVAVYAPLPVTEEVDQ